MMKVLIIIGVVLVGLFYLILKISQYRRKKLIMANSAVSRVFDMSNKREIR